MTSVLIPNQLDLDFYPETQQSTEEPGSIKEAILKKLHETGVLHDEYVTFGLSKHYDKVKTLIECLHYVDGALVGQGDGYIASHDAALNEIFEDALGGLKSFEKPPKVDQMLVAVYGVSCMKYEDFKHWLKSIRGKQHIVSEALHTACFLLNPEYDGFSATFSRLPNSAWRDMMIKKRELMKQFLSYLLPLETKTPVKFYEFIRQLSIELGASDIEEKANKRLANQITTKEEQGKLHCLQQTIPYKDSDTENDGSIYDRPRDPPGQRSVYIPPGDAAMESYRLSTFMKYPQDTPVNPRHLAAAGFHYTGYKDRVKCFCCGLCVESWCVGDDVKSPRWHRSNCEFILGQDCGNQPIGGLFGNFMRPSGSTGAGGDLFRDFGRQGSQNISVQQTARPVPAGMIMKSGPNQSTPMQTARVVEPTRPASQYQRVELATIASPYHEQLVRSLDLRKESDRFKTYENWPAQNRTVYASDLARSGFFYLGNLDRVQCFSCGGVLRNWNYGDNITAEHRRHFPHCRMVQGTETRNVASAVPPPQPIPPRGPGIQEPPDPNETEMRDLMNMFRCQYPVSPYMRNEESRFETFDNRWPASNVRASPRQIAKAGFFFLGDRDRVKCWYCNGGLQNWDPDDEPWTEHAKWFPTCEFLLQRKGPDFVHRMVSLYPNLPRPILRGPFDVPPRVPGANQRAPSPPPPIIDHKAEVAKQQEQVNKFMLGDLVKSATEMGFETSVIRRVVTRRLTSGGNLYTSVADLVDDITANENEPNSDDDDETNTSQPSQTTTVKTPGFTELPTNESMETEISIPPDVTPSMEARIRELQEERKCKICLDKVADIVFVPCGHLCTCTECAEALRKCPICRSKIERGIKTYMS
ncbi:zinc finger protein isoform X1 [Ciona intestinalis]